MTRYRRTEYVIVHRQDTSFVDIPLLLQGIAQLAPLRQTFALSILSGEEHPITSEELEILFAVPAREWATTDEIRGDDPDAGATLGGLAERGLLLSDEERPRLAELRRRDEQLSSSAWNFFAALYHFMTRWGDVDVERALTHEQEIERSGAPSDERLKALAERLRPPPPSFHAIERASATLELPQPSGDGPLHELLLRRKTTRAFDRDRPLTAEELSVVLRYTFGCQGTTPLLGDLVAIRKTSPSGGALHPIEVYPLVAAVDGVEPGLYHYRVDRHALELLSPLRAEEARELAVVFAAGQSYAASAAVVLVLTARFYRNFWKYRHHQKAYSVLLMDAGHVSQTFYLVCTELGLGAFVSAAINNRNIEERLEIDGFEEGALAVCGCGAPADVESELEPNFEPYVLGR